MVARFRVARSSQLRVAVKELSPVCRSLGAFRFRALRGPNVLRLPKRVAGHRLGNGTYLLRASARGRTVFSIRRSLVHTARSVQVRRGGTEDVCTVALAAVATKQSTAAASPAPAHAPFKPPPLSVVPGASPLRDPHAAPSSPFIRAVSLTDAPASIRPLLFVLLAMAIGLLAVASVPQQVLPVGAGTALIASHRGYLAAAGVFLLAVVAVVTAFA